MILKPQDITNIIKTRPNKDLVTAAQDYSKKLTMHVTGIGMANYLAKLDYFEKKELFDIRLKYTRSNKDMFARLHRPIDKIFTASGGSAYYNLPDSAKRQFIELLTDVEWGHSLRNWVRTFWGTAIHTDPMGLFFMEVDQNGNTYPTQKTIQTVYDYRLSGRQPEYIVFDTDQKIADLNLTDKEKLYRVVDDAMDYMIKWDGTNATIISDNSYANHYEKVPAWIISDIYDPIKAMYVSPDDMVIELADQYLREGGILNVFKNNFGFPQRWRYMGDCDKCQGERQYNGETCPACNGSGKKHKYDVSQDINLPIPTKEDPIISPPAGNIEAAVESWDKMDNNIDGLFNLAYYTKWGVIHSIQPTTTTGPNGKKTATEVVMDEQPKIEALYAYSTSAENTEKRIADYLGTFYFGDSYGGSDINYGRRLMLESPDKIMETLMELIKDQAPYEVIREKQEEYYHTLYQGDSVKLNTMLKLIDVEPLPFISLGSAKNLLSPLEYAKKVYYNDWRGLPDTQNMIMKATVEALRQSLEDYTIQRANDEAAKLPESLKPQPLTKPVA